MKKINPRDIKFCLVRFHGKYYVCLYTDATALSESLKLINHSSIKSTIRNLAIFNQAPIFIHAATTLLVAPHAMFSKLSPK